MKFKEVYCDNIRQTLTLDEVTKIYQNNCFLYAQKYKTHFWCPECRKAKLAYNNAATPYFSSYPNSSHDDSCAYRQDELLPEEVEILISNKQNYSQISRQMDSLMHSLFESEKPEKKLSANSYTSPTASNVSNKNITKANKRIPRKRIDATFQDEDFNNLKLFYGDVKFAWEKDENSKNHKIILTKNGKYICKVFVSPKVYPHISSELKSSTPYDCKIVLFTVIEKHEKNYKLTKLLDSRFLQIYRL